jgi:hypothetical protein
MPNDASEPARTWACSLLIAFPTVLMKNQKSKLALWGAWCYNRGMGNALRWFSIQGNGQTDASGLTEAIIAQGSRSRPSPGRGTCRGG